MFQETPFSPSLSQSTAWRRDSAGWLRLPVVVPVEFHDLKLDYQRLPFRNGVQPSPSCTAQVEAHVMSTH
eukprot:4320758-Pleurochrysis_carterae.AAC.6